MQKVLIKLYCGFAVHLALFEILLCISSFSYTKPSKVITTIIILVAISQMR